MINWGKQTGKKFRGPGMIWAHPGKTHRIPKHVELTTDPVELEKRMIEYITTTMKAR